MSNDKEIHEIVCVWGLKNFNRSCVGVELWSPVFVLNELDKSQWRIALCLDNYENNSNYFFNFRLKCVLGEVPVNKIDCELSIMDVNGSPLQKTQGKNCDFSTFGYFNLESLKVEEDIFGLSNSKFFPKDTLTVRCRMQNNSSQVSYNNPELHSFFVRIERSCFLWTLENFCRLQPFQKSKMHLMQDDSNSPVISFEFFFDDYERFHVEVVPSSLCVSIDASFKISVVDASRQVCKTEDFSLCKPKTSLSLKRKELVDNKTLYLPMGILSLHVQCFFTINENIEESTKQFLYRDLYAIRDTAKDTIIAKEIPAEDPVKENSMTGDGKCNSSSHRELFQNMHELYEEGLFTDAKLVDLNGVSYGGVHRSFLSARVPALKTMFVKAQEEKCLLPLVMAEDSMKRILRFAYSDRFEGNLQWKEALTLHIAAKHFSMTDLEHKAYSVLNLSISPSNVCDILMYAITHKAEAVKSAAVEFILSHDDEVIGSTAWMLIQAVHVDLSLEILGELYKRKLGKSSS